MFDKLTKKMAEKMGHSVKNTIEPIRTEMTNKVDSKVDLYSRILRLGLLLILFIDGTKRVNNAVSEQPVSPNQIIINNYMNERSVRDYGRSKQRTDGNKAKSNPR